MTELAHGSNVAGLETTATLDERTDEFVVHTPHLGATKWWIGGELRVLFLTLLDASVRSAVRQLHMSPVSLNGTIFVHQC